MLLSWFSHLISNVHELNWFVLKQGLSHKIQCAVCQTICIPEFAPSIAIAMRLSPKASVWILLLT